MLGVMEFKPNDYFDSYLWYDVGRCFAVHSVMVIRAISKQKEKWNVLEYLYLNVDL